MRLVDPNHSCAFPGCGTLSIQPLILRLDGLKESEGSQSTQVANNKAGIYHSLSTPNV